ncbi:MAG: formate/nitrite transporter family protein [Anaerolineales bacterium]
MNSTPNSIPSIDSLLPPEMAAKAEAIGTRKIQVPPASTFTLAVLAGAFIALGAMFSTTVAADTSLEWPYGLARVAAGLAFSLGLILVVVGGAELFTGNNLIVMAWAGGKVGTRDLLGNWVIVYAGNFVGALGTALLMVWTRQYSFGAGAVGRAALSTAAAKAGLDFGQAFARGVLCNALVCLAVWLSYSARTTVDRIAAVVPPVTAFVAAGFEHSVANMYFLPVAILLRTLDPAFAAASGVDLTDLTWGAFLFRNLLPVTLGNIVGGSLLVAVVYWFVYLRRGQ